VEQVEVVRVPGALAQEAALARAALPQELAEQAVQELAEQAARELAAQGARELAARVARELAERVAPELAARVAREVAARVAPELAERAPRELAAQVARDLSAQAPVAQAQFRRPSPRPMPRVAVADLMDAPAANPARRGSVFLGCLFSCC
jgi:hypothetical protein